MSVSVRTLSQRIQDQTIKSAQAFQDDSIGKLKSQARRDRAELESLAEMLPESQQAAKARVREMVDSYAVFESVLDQMAQDLGTEDTASEAAQQARETAGRVGGQVQDVTEGLTRQAGNGVGSSAGQVESATREVRGTGGQATAHEDGDGAEEPNATEAARQKAEELGVDLNELIGSGARGRITVKDVVNAAEQGEEEDPEATEAARRRAEELGVNLNQLAGSGAEGRITVKDVVNAANQG